MENSTQKPRYTVARRLSKELVEDGFTAVPSAFLEQYHVLKINSSEAILVVHLLSHKWTEKNPFPTYKRLADRMGMTEVAVKNNVRSLEKRGLLKRVSRTGKSNEFDLQPLLRKLESLQASKKAARQESSPTQSS